jgi:ABC-type uncharacterized transport system substrate-binding protein
VEGRNMTIVIRYGEGVPERMAPLARELVALNPDVIVAGAYLATAGDATRTIPIVALTPEDPVEAGFAQSLARPGGNVTGTWTLGNEAMVQKALDLFKLAVPRLARVGALFSRDDPFDRLQISRLPAAARAVGVTRQSARLVDRIIKGTKPGDLPFELPTRYELIVNLKTAKAMGLTISEPFLLLADEVIE